MQPSDDSQNNLRVHMMMAFVTTCWYHLVTMPKMNLRIMVISISHKHKYEVTALTDEISAVECP